MALINIEYGSLASSETVNKNFTYLDEKIAESNESIMTSISSILSNIATINARINDISENMIAFSDGNVYSIYANMSYCAEYDASDNKNPIKPCDLKYISKGDYVYYYARKYRDVYSVFGLVAIR